MQVGPEWSPRTALLSDTGAGTRDTAPQGHGKGKARGQVECWDGSGFPTTSLTSSKNYLRACFR